MPLAQRKTAYPYISWICRLLKSDCAKGGGRHAVALPERARKMGCAVKPAALSDLLDRRIRGAQQVFRLPQPVLQQIFMRRTANVSLKAANQVRFADAALFSKQIQSKFLCKMAVDIPYGRLQKAADRSCQFPRRGKPAQNTVDTGRDLMFIGEHAAGGTDHRDEMLAERLNVRACMDTAEPLVQIIRVGAAAASIEVEPEKVHSIFAPVSVRLPAVEQADLVCPQFCFYAVIPDMERPRTHIQQQVLVKKTALYMVGIIADEMPKLRAEI